MYKAVLFDLDDTLIDRQKSLHDVFKKMILDHAEIDDPIELEAIIQDCLIFDMWGNVSRYFIEKQLKDKYDFDFKGEDATKWWIENQGKVVYPDPKAVDVLHYLKQKGYKIGLVTNGTIFGQNEKIDNAHLREFFDTIVIGLEYNTRKPNPLLFEIALEKLGILPSEAIYVGDTYGNDILGAYRAHMDAIWLRPHNRWHNEDGIVRCIDDISQLKEIL